MRTKELAYQKISELVERFEEQYASYKNSEYNETLTRRDFIDPFFKALGWDVDNENGYAESYREVIHEDKVRVGSGTKAPDYSFRLSGGKRLFFVEAKKPSVDIKGEIQPAFQVRRYGWSAKLPVSIITDFEEFAVYDCTQKPLLTDKASKARIRYLTFREYLDQFDFLWETFSKEKVLKGSFDRFVQSDTQKKGTTTVDQEFLQSLDSWRSQLAVSLVRTNKQLTEEEINFAVQQTINRIIFLRIAEDRGVEKYDSLKQCVSDTKPADNIFYKNLFRIFEHADDKYNSGLFDFEKDKISITLKVDNKTLKSIINDLYYPGPYDFSVMPVEILGSAYEQFLGKTIRVTSGHSVKIEEKLEVRKAGGVYYTPQYVVDYIVQNTVGKLLEGKTPKDAAKIKIVDPACGSGSFLLGAFQYLLDWHLNFYTQKNGKLSRGLKTDVLTPDGKLTTAEKKRILLNNIYGVDIDVNAVEITKLSLLLKCMEGETTASIETMQRLFHERVLPSIDDNICNGNSLIDTDFYDNQLDFKEEKKIKPFSWKHAFSDVFKQGGFDIVIGNPPYGTSFIEAVKKYFWAKFKNQNYQLESYMLFLEQAFVLLLKEGGKYGMIFPNPWLTNLRQRNLRKFIFEKATVNEIIHFKQPVFPQTTVDTEIVLLTNIRVKNNIVKITIVEKGSSLRQDKHEIITHNQEEWIAAKGDVINIFQTTKEKKLSKKILKDTTKLEEYFTIHVGIKPYQAGKGKPKQTKSDVTNRVFDSDRKKNNLYRAYLRGVDINRYSTLPLKERYIKFGLWLAEPRPVVNFDADVKIFMRQTGDSLIGTIDTKQYLCLNNMHVLVPKATTKCDAKYFLGIINSRLLNWYYQSINPEKGEALAEVKKANIAILPIKIANVKVQHEIIRLVDQLLKLNEEKSKTKLQTEISQIETKINYCEDKINSLIYELYGLTDKEIKIVENS